MERERQLYELLFGSPMFEDWHWFRYHFERKLRGDAEPFAEAIIEACLDCESSMPGYASRTLRVLASIGGREKDDRDYDQLLQLLAEVLIVRQLVTSPWARPLTFEFDASPSDGKRNVELTIQTAGRTIGIEVKAPALLQHQRVRSTRKVQAVSRGVPLDQVYELADEPSELTLPRDNPLKDFLMSAELKFGEFKHEQPGFVGALVIVWDDFIYEPLTALVHPSAGLLTENSFARDEHGKPLRFSSVDGIVLVRHLHQFANAAAERRLVDSIGDALDYGRAGGYPPKAYVPNPYAAGLPEELLEALQASDYRNIPGAEYSANDLVLWMAEDSYSAR